MKNTFNTVIFLTSTLTTDLTGTTHKALDACLSKEFTKIEGNDYLIECYTAELSDFSVICALSTRFNCSVRINCRYNPTIVQECDCVVELEDDDPLC